MSKYGEYRRNREDYEDRVRIWENKGRYEGIEGNMGGFWVVGWGVVWNCNSPQLYITSYHNNLLCDPPLSEYNEYSKFSENSNF